jgi:hypothetical protein
MNGTRDTGHTGTADGGGLDPRQAATLLQTRLRARRQFEPAPPWLLVVRAILVLAACGTVWLSVRGQHPYQRPTVPAVLVMVAFGILNTGVTVAVAKHAGTGIGGKSRLHRVDIAIMAVAWIAVYVVMVAMAFAGVSPAIVYGVYPITVPLIVGGLAGAAVMAARARWRECGTALAVAVVGTVCVFAGPAGAWAVAGIGLCLVLLAAVAIVWQQRMRDTP